MNKNYGNIIFGFVMGMLLGVCCGVFRGMTIMRKKAIDVNVAEYYLDKDDIKQFRWKGDTDG